MRRRLVGALALSTLLFGVAPDVQADIIFSVNQGSVSPDENVVFNEPGLIAGPALTVTGATNNTGLIVEFTGTENLVTPSQGAARIEAQDPTGYTFLEIDLADNDLFFSEFEANVRIFSQTSGDADIEACDQFGDCQTFNLALDEGENFFVLSVMSQQLIDLISIDTSPLAIMDVRQVRVSVAECDATVCEDITIPEPTTFVLFGLALAGGAVRMRRRSQRSSL
jgi:hypothetical protein